MCLHSDDGVRRQLATRRSYCTDIWGWTRLTDDTVVDEDMEDQNEDLMDLITAV